VTVIHSSTRGTSVSDLWYKHCLIRQCVKATSDELGLKASKVRIRAENRYLNSKTVLLLNRKIQKILEGKIRTFPFK